MPNAMLSERNTLILDALKDGASVRDVAAAHNLSDSRVRGIRSEAEKYQANGRSNGAAGEIGLSGLKHSWGSISEEFLTDLNTVGKRYKLYNEMRMNSPVSASTLLAIELSIRRVEWRIEGDNERAEFIEGAWGDTSHSWNDHISEALTMLPFGWAWSEIVYKRRKGTAADPASNFSDGKIGWRKFGFRSQDSLYRWDFDDHGNVQAMIQQAWPDFQLRTIPLTKSILYRTSREKNNPEGRSLLRSSYIPYYYAKNLQAIEAIGAERDLAGLPHITLHENANADEGSTDVDRAKNLVRRVRQDQLAGVVTPFGWDFKLVSSGGSKQFDVGSIITRYEKRIAMNMLAQFIMLGMDKVGSFSLSSDQSDFFVMAVSAFADIIAETFSTFAIPRLLKLNGMNLQDPPKLTHGPLGTPDLQAIGQYFSQLGKIGFVQPDEDLEQWFRQQVNAPELTEEAIKKRQEQTPPVQRVPEQEDEGEDETEDFDARIEKFAAHGKTVRQRINEIDDRKLKRRILNTSKDLTDLGDKLSKRSLDSIRAITDEEWERAQAREPEEFGAIKARQWHRLVEEFTPVMKLVHGRARWGALESSRYEAEIYGAMVAEYEQQIGEELAVLGCNRSVNLTNTTVLENLRREANEQGVGIVDTYNRDLAYAVRAIKSEVPTANRNVYLKRLGSWHSGRDRWKSDQIALVSRMGARNSSVKEFVRRNRVEAEAFVGGPRPAVEEECQALINAEPFPASNLPADFPLHINCPHDWRLRNVKTDTACEELWTGT